MAELLLSTLVVVLGYMFAIWILSLLVGRVGIIDAFWGPGFVLLAVLCGLQTPATLNRRPELIVLIGLIVIWGMRLGIHLSIRVFTDPHEDRRYAAMRTKHEPGWWIKSLGFVFLLQGIIMWFVSLPVTTAFAFHDFRSPGLLGASGVLLWGLGVFFEMVGDWQLVRFRADPKNRDRVLNTGLWALTRHPNYFGDFAVWWGLWLFSFSCGAPFWTIASPVAMSYFLLNISGVRLLEKDIAERRPGYAEYVRSTNAFFPGPKRRS